jgi:hypothetical protein
MIRGLACLTLLAVLACPLAAQEPPQVKKLTVVPAAAPSPALQYQLLPELRDMTPGNAALLYQRAHSPDWWATILRLKVLENEKLNHWLEMPLENLPRKEIRVLENFNGLREIDLAARRENCYWELTDRVKAEGIALLIPDWQTFRSYGALLAARCRLEMADGKIDKSVYTLQTGFKFSRDVADAPTLIQALVGMAIAQYMAARVEDLMERPGAPNLYWALSTLPDPFIDLRKPLQGERLFLDSTFPELRTIETTIWDSHQQQSFMDRLTKLSELIRGWGFHTPSDLESKLLSVLMVTKTYPEAKQFLLARGRSAAQVEAMPAMQVCLLYWMHNYESLQDDYHKWMALPYWQARAGMHKAAEDIRAAAARFERFPFLDLLPAITKIYDARARIDRHLAALRCIEAIRLYAASHDGKPPSSLADITEVPVPIDPTTGHAFDYAVNGNVVTLREAGLAAGRPMFPAWPLNYEITFKR